MDYGNLSFTEFLDNCYKGIIKSKIDMYDFLKLKSNNFERGPLEYLIFDIRNYIYKIDIYIPKEDKYIGGYMGRGQVKLPTTYDYFTLKSIVSKFDLNFSFEQVTDLAFLKFEDNLTMRERIEILKSKLPIADFDYTKCESYLPNFLIMSDIAENEYGKIIETTVIETTINRRQPPKQTLTFSGLFNGRYSDYIDLLFEKLKDIGIIDNNNIWRKWETGKVEKNETSKLYYFLKQKKILNDYDDTPALICFNEKFGIEVYKYNETPKTERFVSIKTLTDSKKTAPKTNLLDKFEIVFNKWIEKIELK